MKQRAGLIISMILFIVLTFCLLSYANDNIIYGCYKKNNGQLRIVNHAGGCLSSEVPISWNQAGLPGPPGPAGPAGSQGPCNDCGNGSSITVRRMEPGPCAGGYGWCPDGFNWAFRIQDSAVNEGSAISTNVINSRLIDCGCEVGMIGAGEFLIFCTGWDYVEKGAILHYAVFNP